MNILITIFNKMKDTAQGKLSEKARHYIDQAQLSNKLTHMEDELYDYLQENYGDKTTYYNSLQKYILNGTISLDENGNDRTSAFYYTLIRGFLYSDKNYLGETRFSNYHWDKIQIMYPNDNYDEKDIKACFLHFYKTFKDEFGCSLSDDRALANDIKDTVNDNSDKIIKKISNLEETINANSKEIQRQHDTGLIQQPIIEEKIVDDNDEYREKFEDTLFLESDIRDGKKAALRDVYIEPHIKFDYDSLKQWAELRDSRVLVLYGKAGIGKSSFTSWLCYNNYFIQGCHILELRSCIDKLDSQKPWDSIKESFNCTNDDKYQNTVLILDGLDEVCVLKSNFDGNEFICNLAGTLQYGVGRNIRIIITSRMGYFGEIKKNNSLDFATIYWEEDSVENWCKEYCKIHDNSTDWCESFKTIFTNLDESDKRKEVFCTPLVLYICCVSGVDISKHESVASIYDEAFNIIGTRRYNKWTEDKRKDFEINRQFTKELAFQMFLNDKLEDILESSFVEIAKEKVKSWAQEKQSYQVNSPDFEKLFAINHFAYKKNKAIEFAHKTIGEYFTAVKLYEDYFEHILGNSLEDIWRNIFNAFRYKSIPNDIMDYLVAILKKKQDETWKAKFFKAYYTGIEKQTLSMVSYSEPEYQALSSALISQMQIAFRNLTCFLTFLGFKNDQFSMTNKNLQILSSYFYGDIIVCNWKNLELLDLKNAYLKNANFLRATLNGIDFYEAILNSAIFIGAELNGACFKRANLENAFFSYAYLNEAHFERAHLEEAHLNESHLERAHLEEAHLKYADLKKTHLEEAYLERAHLIGAHLEGAHLEGAYLEEAHLEGAYLEEAHLENSFLEGTHLEYVDLTKTHLEGAHFNGAHLEGALLKPEDLEEARLQGAYLDSEEQDQ